MQNQNKFVVIADNEVIMHFVVHKHDDGVTDGVLAGLRSDPKIIELSENVDPSIGFGWKYVGGSFISPHSAPPVDDEYEVE